MNNCIVPDFGYKRPDGYVLVWTPNSSGTGWKRARAHRIAWIEKNGPIPKGKFICHRCDNPSCMNVDHLFLGSPRDNSIDMAQKGRHYQQLKTHCKSGHEFTVDNTYVTKAGHRQCRQCNSKTGRKYHAKQKRMAN